MIRNSRAIPKNHFKINRSLSALLSFIGFSCLRVEAHESPGGDTSLSDRWHMFRKEHLLLTILGFVVAAILLVIICSFIQTKHQKRFLKEKLPRARK